MFCTNIYTYKNIFRIFCCKNSFVCLFVNFDLDLFCWWSAFWNAEMNLLSSILLLSTFFKCARANKEQYNENRSFIMFYYSHKLFLLSTTHCNVLYLYTKMNFYFAIQMSSYFSCSVVIIKSVHC